MADGFWSGLNQHWLFWSGWVFTVGAATASLWIIKEYGWIGFLLWLAAALSFLGFANQKHREMEEAAKRNEGEKKNWQAELASVRERAEQSERKLNEIPANLLLQLQATIQRHSFEELAKRLERYAGYVGRMIRLAETVAKPITLRTFVKRAGALYVDAKLSADGLNHLRQDDPFLLEFKEANALVTGSAILRVHQMNPAKELVWFRVVDFEGDEMVHIDALAEKQEVPGKGYSARPLCDQSRYANRNLGETTAVIRQLTEDLLRLSGIET